MDDYVPRKEFNDTVSEIRRDMSELRDAVVAFRTSAENINAAVAQATKIFYGEQQNGLLFVVNELRTKMGAIQWVVVTISTALIGTGIARIMGAL